MTYPHEPHAAKRGSPGAHILAYRAITLTVLFPQHYNIASIAIKFRKLEEVQL